MSDSSSELRLPILFRKRCGFDPLRMVQINNLGVFTWSSDALAFKDARMRSRKLIILTYLRKMNSVTALQKVRGNSDTMQVLFPDVSCKHGVHSSDGSSRAVGGVFTLVRKSMLPQNSIAGKRELIRGRALLSIYLRREHSCTFLNLHIHHILLIINSVTW